MSRLYSRSRQTAYSKLKDISNSIYTAYSGTLLISMVMTTKVKRRL